MEKGRKGERNSFDFTFQQALNGRMFQANLGKKGTKEGLIITTILVGTLFAGY